MDEQVPVKKANEKKINKIAMMHLPEDESNSTQNHVD